jgi:magnesium-transporting ATPase (P-type)
MMFLAGYGMFHWHLQNGSSEAHARTAAVTVFVVIEMLYLFNCRSLIYPLRHVGFWTNKWVFIGVGVMLTLQLLFVYAPWMNRLFHTSALSLQDWAIIIGIGVVVYVAVAIEKRLRLRVLKRHWK